ncbi:hypothetical protein OH461_06015 [Vibrio sp. LaRot3]|nr:hypothetical protein [Vibrio sp. LaRot3]MDA0147944.1 hypothetical protein [Vibrio sp. LaRot3]
MKRRILIAAVGVTSMMASISAVASDNAHPELAVGLAVDQQLSVVIELDERYRFIIGNQGTAFDYIAMNGEFDVDEPVTWYAGVGAWNEWDDGFGLRVPLGLNYQVSQNWQMYGQIQPELNMYKGWELGIGGAIGAKYHF